MYRYIVDDTIVYTPEDLVLFRESPFAVWMERLTLENPDHGIPPDLDSIASIPVSPQREDIVATLRAEGRNVTVIDTTADEPERRAITLKAMRQGADFIVNGHLAVGAVAGAVDLLMRASGFSELGDYLYIPCETRTDSSLQSAFRLCFFADLLANLQNQLPPQMLIIRGGTEVVPLQTEDHIYYFQGVQRRFMQAMAEFRKHAMPDPVESAHFGRWAECASEVLKQRALSENATDDEQLMDEPAEEVVEIPQLRVAGAGSGVQFAGDLAVRAEDGGHSYRSDRSALSATARDLNDSGQTLAEQARKLTPGSFGNGRPPGHTPSLALAYSNSPRMAPVVEDEVKPQDVIPDAVADTREAPAPGVSLESAAFNSVVTPETADDTVFQIDRSAAVRPAPAPNLRDTARRESAAKPERSVVASLPDLEPRPPVFLPPDEDPAISFPPEQLTTDERGHFDDSLPEGPQSDSDHSSVIDMDRAPSSALQPVVQRAEAVFERLIRDDPYFKKPEAPSAAKTKAASAADSDRPSVPFSSSLNTSEEFGDS